MADRWEPHPNSRKRFTQSKSMESYMQSQHTNQFSASSSYSASSSTAGYKIYMDSEHGNPSDFPRHDQNHIQYYDHSRNQYQEQGSASHGGGYGFNAPRVTKSKSGSMQVDEADLQRRRRVAAYKAYATEDRIKSSFRKSFRWLKDKCSTIRHGLW